MENKEECKRLGSAGACAPCTAGSFIREDESMVMELKAKDDSNSADTKEVRIEVYKGT